MAPIRTQNGISFSSNCGTRNSDVSATVMAEADTRPEVLRTISM